MGAQQILIQFDIGNLLSEFVILILRMCFDFFFLVVLEDKSAAEPAGT